MASPSATLAFGNFLNTLARRKLLCCLLIGASVLILRAVLLPIWPITVPAIDDEFCYVLQADTFAHFRLTNPHHPMWRFFETIYVIQNPTYAAKYPPAQGLVMALGQILLGHPWFGVWLSCGLLAGTLCWALQAWLPGRWALLGGAIAFPMCFYSYWMNSFWGGALTATGGALVFGAWRRITMPAQQKAVKTRAAWILGMGSVLTILCRPFEGTLLVLPLLATLFRADRSRGFRTPVLLCGLAGALWLGYYQYRVTGSPFLMPYTEYQRQYETVPQFNFLPVASEARSYPHLDFEWVDKAWLKNEYDKSRSPQFVLLRLQTWYTSLKEYLGSPLLIIPLLGFLPLSFRSQKMRVPVLLFGLIVAATFLEVAQFAHYPAPFTPVILLLAVQGIRHGFTRGGRPLTSLLLLVSFAQMALTEVPAIARRQTPDRFKAAVWKKGSIEANLSRQNGRHVIFVRYTQFRQPHEEWIYNSADIDGQAVIWAQDMGTEENRKLIAYYPDRTLWRFEPDESSDNLIPYQ